MLDLSLGSALSMVPSGEDVLDRSAWPVVLEKPLLAVLLDRSVAPAVVVRPRGTTVLDRSEWIVIFGKTVRTVKETESAFVDVIGKVTPAQPMAKI